MTNRDYIFIVGALIFILGGAIIHMFYNPTVVNTELCMAALLFAGASLLFFKHKKDNDLLAGIIIQIIKHLQTQKVKDNAYTGTFNQIFNAFEGLDLGPEIGGEAPEISETKIPVESYKNTDTRCKFPFICTAEELDFCEIYKKHVDGKLPDLVAHCKKCDYWGE